MKRVFKFLGVFIICLSIMAPAVATGDNTLEEWSCSPDSGEDVSHGYYQKVLDVLQAIEVDVMTYASWDLLYRTTGDSSAEVMGSGGCIPSNEMRNMDDCFACINSARQHLMSLCPKNSRGSVFLDGCTLMFARLETGPKDVDEFEWDQRILDDERVIDDRAAI